MASSPALPSEYLQTRLRERRVQSAQTGNAPNHHNHENTSRRSTCGRDDFIFADDPFPPRRRSASRTHQSSPTNARSPIHHLGHGRQASNSISVASTSRTMGAREAEDHMDKLLKLNFDLKMEIQMRREKAEELEKRIEEIPQLKEDNAELIELNEDLIEELNQRDHAIDEATGMICELEDKVQALEDQLNQFRRRDSRTVKGDARSESSHADQPRSRPRRKRQDPKRLSVSPEVSSKMVELSSEVTQPTNHAHPSMSNNERRLQNLSKRPSSPNRQMAPKQSVNSLASQSIAPTEGEFNDDALGSPALSDISDSELKSVYGRDEATFSRNHPHNEYLDSDSPTKHSSASERSTLARVNRWVNDRAISPDVGSKPTSRQSNPHSRGFQSLGGVLHDSAPLEAGPRSSQQEHTPKASDHVDPKIYPPGFTNQVYGQNVFPPTPDTMMTRDTTRPSTTSTRPSNQSSLSFVGEKNNSELLVTPTHGSWQQPQNPPGAPSSQEKEYIQRGSALSQDIEEFRPSSDAGSSPPRLEKTSSRSLQSSGGLSLRDFSPAQQARHRPNASQREHSYDADTARRSLPPNSSFNSAGFSMRHRPGSARGEIPMDIHGASIALEDQSILHRRSISATPTQQTFFSMSPETWQEKGSGDNVVNSRTGVRGTTSHSSRSSNLINCINATSAARSSLDSQQGLDKQPDETNTNVPPDPSKQTDSFSIASERPALNTSSTRPTDTLRQRVSRFTRRNSSSSQKSISFNEKTSNVNTRADKPPSSMSPAQGQMQGSTPTPPSNSGTPSLSRRTRQLFHRRQSSAAKRSPTSPQSQAAPRSPTARSSPTSPSFIPLRRSSRAQSGGNLDQDTIAQSRLAGSSAFIDAAKAAASHLDKMESATSTPSKGFATSIPILSSPTGPQPASEGKGHSRMTSNSSTSQSYNTAMSRLSSSTDMSKVGVEVNGRNSNPTMTRSRRESESRRE